MNLFYRVLVILSYLLVVLGLVAPVTFVAELPGPVLNVLDKQKDSEIIQIEDKTLTDPTTSVKSSTTTDESKLLMLTVSVYGGPQRYLGFIQIIWQFFNQDNAILPTEMVYPLDETSSENDEKTQSQMEGAQSSAVTAALSYLGKSSQDYNVNISVEEVGGPSAGLIFALGIVDKIQVQNGQSSFIGKHIIAGTGTIGEDREVGAIGGINQKLTAAHNNGATLFLMPESNCSGVDHFSYSNMRIVPVETLDEAVDVIKLYNQDPNASFPTCANQTQ